MTPWDRFGEIAQHRVHLLLAKERWGGWLSANAMSVTLQSVFNVIAVGLFGWQQLPAWSFIMPIGISVYSLWRWRRLEKRLDSTTDAGIEALKQAFPKEAAPAEKALN
jgi:hypothetical protein